MDFILKVVMKLVEEVMSEITKQVNVVQTQALDPITGFVKQVVGGAWTGPDADKFVNDLNGEISKAAQGIMGSVSGFSGGINNALQRIAQADQQATQEVGDLLNTFGGIFG